MDVDLVESGRVRLTGESEGACFVLGDPIPEDHHRVSLVLEFVGDDGFVFISVGAVDDFASGLRGLGNEEVEIGEAEVVKQVLADEKGGFRCVVCEDDEYSGRCLATNWFYRDGNRHWMGDLSPFLHGGCYEEFVDGLLGVWDYSDELLSEQL